MRRLSRLSDLPRRVGAELYTRVRLVASSKDRGDVPGWVMITIMTATLVIAILSVFQPKIKEAVGNAIDRVSNANGG